MELAVRSSPFEFELTADEPDTVMIVGGTELAPRIEVVLGAPGPMRGTCETSGITVVLGGSATVSPPIR
jgi:hypothetical protein